MLFSNYRLQKTWLDKCLKSPVSEDTSTSDMVNGPKRCFSPRASTFTIFINHCYRNSVGKNLCLKVTQIDAYLMNTLKVAEIGKSLLVILNVLTNSPKIFKILGLFVNTLTAEKKDYLVNRDNLTQHIQMALTKKQKKFSLFFSSSLKFR